MDINCDRGHALVKLNFILSETLISPFIFILFMENNYGTYKGLQCVSVSLELPATYKHSYIGFHFDVN